MELVEDVWFLIVRFISVKDKQNLSLTNKYFSKLVPKLTTKFPNGCTFNLFQEKTLKACEETSENFSVYGCGVSSGKSTLAVYLARKFRPSVLVVPSNLIEQARNLCLEFAKIEPLCLSRDLVPGKNIKKFCETVSWKDHPLIICTNLTLKYLLALERTFIIDDYHLISTGANIKYLKFSSNSRIIALKTQRNSKIKVNSGIELDIQTFWFDFPYYMHFNTLLPDVKEHFFNWAHIGIEGVLSGEEINPVISNFFHRCRLGSMTEEDIEYISNFTELDIIKWLYPIYKKFYPFDLTEILNEVISNTTRVIIWADNSSHAKAVVSSVESIGYEVIFFESKKRKQILNELRSEDSNLKILVASVEGMKAEDLGFAGAIIVTAYINHIKFAKLVEYSRKVNNPHSMLKVFWLQTVWNKTPLQDRFGESDIKRVLKGANVTLYEEKFYE